MADSLCIPSDDGGGIMPEPADRDPFVGKVPVLLIILLPDCKKGPAESIEEEVVVPVGGRGDRVPPVSWLNLAADDRAYSGCAGGLLVNVVDADTGFRTPKAAPEPWASRRLALELARRRRDLKRVTNGEADCGCCGE